MVRLLRPVVTFSAAGPASRSQRSSIALDPGWAVENLGVALFLQDSETLEIHAAAVRHRIGGAAGREKPAREPALAAPPSLRAVGPSCVLPHEAAGLEARL